MRKGNVKEGAEWRERESRNSLHEQRKRHKRKRVRGVGRTNGRREGETEIVRKRERNSYSGNDVVAMETLSSARLLHRCLVGIFKALH